MTNVKDYLKILEDDPFFQEWNKENPDSYLCHCFKMVDEANEKEWQIGFYNKDDTITTFVVREDSVQKMDPSEIFKKPESKVKELNADDIGIDEAKAIEAAKAHAKKNFSKEVLAKTILILQNLDIGVVYNITFVTVAMNTLNIKVDAKSGKILDDKLTSLMDFTVDKK